MPSEPDHGERGVILVVHEDRKTQRMVHRILGATLYTIDACETLTQASRLVAKSAPSLIVIDHRLMTEPAAQKLAASAKTRGTRGCLVLVTDGDASDIPALFTVGSLTNMMAHPMPVLAEELTVTALKLLRRDIFGLEKYMAWGVEPVTTLLTDVDQRTAAVDALANDVRAFGLGPRVASMSSLVADELLSNALFDAPVDAAGQRTRVHDPRHDPRALSGRERVRLRYACDARYLAIEVTDQFGSLDRQTILRFLAKAADRGTDQVDLEGPGAGMGIALSYSCCTHLVFNLAPGARTQAIGLIDVRFKPAQLGAPAPSFNVFIEEES